MEEKKTNAQRFIECYNRIDENIRNQHDFKRSMGFSDMVRRAVSINHIVRKYEDELIDYGRLRNAIVHKSNDNFLIAEPHDDVVEKFEKIAKLLCTPPRIIETNCLHDVFTITHDVLLANVIEIMKQTNYSNIPVFKNNTLIGVANGQRIIESIGEKLLAGEKADEFLYQTKIEDVLPDTLNEKYYAVASVNQTVDGIMKLFYQNRKLLCIILTKNGKFDEFPVGILTNSDYMELNKVIENF